MPEAINSPAARQVVVSRAFNATAETVFDAWLNPTAVGNWLFTTPGGRMARVELHPHVGGNFVIAEKRGEMVTEHLGTYLAIERPRRLVFTFSVPQYSAVVTCVTVEIGSHGNGCLLTLTHVGVLPEYHERTATGWTAILERLAVQISAPS